MFARIRSVRPHFGRPSRAPPSHLAPSRPQSTSPPPPRMDHASFLTPISARRQPSAIRALQRFLAVPGLISLGGGNPHPSTFPVEGLTLRLKDGDVIDVPEADVARALQYSATNGLPELVAALRELQKAEHRPPNFEALDICVGNGSQDVLTKAFEMLLAEGDHLLIESPAYVGSLAFLRPLGVKFAEVKVDGNGIVPESLEEVLATWPDAATRPRVLYTVPTGGNPTGASTTQVRKRRVYEIAQRYNVIILEDDPYHYLAFGSARTPSYLSMDVDGRVLRFDSLSKVFSAGLRVGWVTGAKPFVDRIALHAQTTLLHPSGVSQLVASQILGRWGVEGFLAHVDKVATFYEEKGKVFLALAEKHLQGLAEWTEPTAGMFVWLKLVGIEDSSELIKKAADKKVLLVPGFEFYPNPRKTPYVRASFSTATAPEMDEALSRLASVIRSEQK